jgi:hypothetical protein
MLRLRLAVSSFFRLLLGGKLHPKAAKYLSESALSAAIPAAEKSDKAADKEDSTSAKPKSEAAPKKTSDGLSSRLDGALTMLGLLQREGRLIDFLLESLDDYEDSDIGAAVRDIHRGCSKVLSEQLAIEAVMPGEEDDPVTVPKGFDPGEIRLAGEVAGDPPFQGVLRHHGWRVTKIKLPTLAEGVDRHVIAPAEVEIS